MDQPTKDRREASRDNGVYNAIIDAEQEIWNRGARFRAQCFVPRGRNCFTRWFWTWWDGGPDVGRLKLDPNLTYGDDCLGNYADIEKGEGREERCISRRERFKILTQPETTVSGIWCKAQRIEAQDYAATQHIRLVRGLILVAILQVFVLILQSQCRDAPNVLQTIAFN